MIRLGQQLARNILSSWAGFFTRIVITFFFVPYITSVLGDSRYGVWVIVFQTINYFSLLDLGLERALTRYVSKFLGKTDFKNINRVLNTSTALYIAIGTAVIGLAWLTSAYLFDYFKISDSVLSDEGKAAMLIIGVYAGIRFYLLPFGGSLAAFQRTDISTALGIAEDIIRTGIMVWLLSEGYGLETLAACVFATAVIRQLITIVWLKKLFPEVALKASAMDRETASSLFSYSKISFGITLAWLVIFGTDSILLGLVSSSAAAGVYAPGAQLMLYIRNIINGVGAPLNPAVSHLEANGQHDKIRQLYLKGVKYVSFFSFFVASGVVIYAPDFVHLWLSAEFAGAAEVMIVLAAGLTVFLPQIIGNAILFGTEKHKYLLIVLVIEAVMKLGLSLALVGEYGLIGIALGNTIPQVILYTTLYPYFMARILKLSTLKVVFTGLSTGLLAAAVAVPTGLLARAWLTPDTWPIFFVNVAIVTGTTALAFVLIFSKEDRQRLAGYLRGQV